MKKLMKRLVSGLLMLVLCVSMIPACSLFIRAAGAENIYYITPQLGDGASIDQKELEELYVKGVLYKNGYFTFTETRVLTFTVKLEAGWTYCSEYSSVFSGSAGSLVTTEGNGSVTFKYTASAGRSIRFASLKNVCINTTADELPKLYLNVKGSFDQVSKERWVDCDIRLTLGTKNYNSGDFVGSGQVKGRGNYSWQKEQKPYSINLTEKASLLDIPETRKYAIVSTICDESLVRNLITYATGQDLKGIDYVVRAEPVEVYLNDHYNGIYTLVERIRISDTKVIEEVASPDNVDGAYIMEKTVTGKMGDDDVFFEAPFLDHPNSSNQKDIFSLHDPDTASDAMVAYCQNVVNKAHAAILSSSDTAYKQYIDVDSWVDFLIMQEVGKNVDGELKTSAYFLIPSGSEKLHFTSLWDFDLAYGNADWNNDDSGSGVTISGTPNAEPMTQFMVISASCTWFRTLWEKPSFQQAVKERYTEYRTTILEDMINRIDTYSAYMKKSVDEKEAYVPANKVEKGVSQLKKWINGRLEWLDKQWLLDSDEVAAHSISVSVSGRGTVTPSDGVNTVVDGGSKTYTIVPESGYSVSKVTFDGRDVTSQLKLGTYTTPYLSDDSHLVVTLVADGSTPDDTAYSIFVDETLGGGTTTVSVDSSPAGAVITVTGTAHEGYRLSGISVDGLLLGSNAFVMPAHDVTVTALYEEYVDTTPNRTALSEAIVVCTTDVMRAISNQSCAAISDSYTGILEQAELLSEDEEASVDRINASAMELLRMYGIMNRSAISAKELSALAKVAELAGLSEETVTEAGNAAAGTDTALMTAAWDKVMDEYYTTPSTVLLESVCSAYGNVTESDYKADTYAAFAPAYAAAKTVLANTSASQSAIDGATAELSYAGRHLEPIRPDKDDTDKPILDDKTSMAIKIIAIVLAVAAAGAVTAVVVTLVKRKSKKN